MGNLIPRTQLIPQNPNQDEEDQEEEHQDEEEEVVVVEEADEDDEDTITCEICIEPIAPSSKKFKNNNVCVHSFCTDCMIKYIEVKLETNISDIKCPVGSCTHSVEPLSCRKKIPCNLFIKWCDVLCDSTVLGIDRVYCPNMECSELILNECGQKKLKRCVCPHCKKPFCFWCKVPWHAGYSCEESGETRGEDGVAFGIICKTEGWKRCPMCRYFVERISSCKNFTCRCGIDFCYKCGQRRPRCQCTYTPRGKDLLILFGLFIVSVLLVILFWVLWAIVNSLISHKSFIECFMEIMRELYTEVEEGRGGF